MCFFYIICYSPLSSANNFFLSGLLINVSPMSTASVPFALSLSMSSFALIPLSDTYTIFWGAKVSAAAPVPVTGTSVKIKSCHRILLHRIRYQLSKTNAVHDVHRKCSEISVVHSDDAGSAGYRPSDLILIVSLNQSRHPKFMRKLQV